MTNYKLNILLVLNLILTSCNEENVSRESNSNKKEILKEVNSVNTIENQHLATVPESDHVPDELNNLCRVFYTKFCLGLPDPMPILDENGFYVLDLKTYKDDMSKLNLFTQSFINKQDDIFSECKNALENDSITPQDVPDGIDVSAPFECGFFHYNYYLESQETPNGFYLRNSKYDAFGGFTEVHFYTAVQDSFFTWDNQIVLQLDVQKLKEGWKISNVKKVER